MGDITITSNVADFSKWINESNNNVEKAKVIALKRIGMDMEGEAKRNAPLKTGTLRKSITHKSDSEKVEVGTNLIYARIQDLGGVIVPKTKPYLVFKIGNKLIKTKRVVIPKYKGVGYLTPAFKKMATDKAKEIFKEEFDKISQP